MGKENGGHKPHGKKNKRKNKRKSKPVEWYSRDRRAIVKVTVPVNCCECDRPTPKYKCPSCLKKYCSTVCCRAHKERCELRKSDTSETSAASESLPGTSKSLPGTSKSLPGTSKSLPGTSGSLPGASESLPGTSGSLPGTSESLPGTSESLPGTSESLPGTSESLPGTSESLPGTSESLPGTSESLPGTSESLPAASGSLPAASGSLPAASGSLPAASANTQEKCQRKYNYEFPTADTVPLEKLTQIKDNETIRNMLGSKRLRGLITTLDDAHDPKYVFREIMKDPQFKEFSNAVLDIVG